MNNALKTVLLSIGLLALPMAQAHSPSAHKTHHTTSSAPAEQKDWGIAGDPKKATRTIEIRMTDDMRFAPNQIQVKLGETVRLVAVNAGQVLHEIVIGTPQELKAHAEMMKKHPGMDGPEYKGRKDAYDVLLVQKDGSSKSFQHYPGLRRMAQRDGLQRVSDDPAALPWATAEVRRIDKAASKVALKHGEIKNLDMPPMSMVFQVRAPAQLDALQVGQKVRFQAVQDKGAYWVVKIEPTAL